MNVPAVGIVVGALAIGGSYVSIVLSAVAITRTISTLPLGIDVTAGALIT